VAPVGFLDANLDTSLGDYVFPKGETLAALLRPAAVDETNFVDPLAFRPERWLEDLGGPHNVSAYMPFGSGPRMCPGRTLAQLEMRGFLSMLYKNFDVQRVGSSTEVSELFGFTMSPKGLRAPARPAAGPRLEGAPFTPARPTRPASSTWS
jgi:cytochrome P450